MKNTPVVSSAQTIFDTPEYKRSRNGYLLHCAFEYFITLIISDAFLAKLLSHLGLPDTVIGVVSSIASIAFLFQISVIVFAQRIRHVKQYVITLSTVSQLLFITLYFIPFLPLSGTTKSVLVVLFLILGYLCRYCMSPVIFRWGNSFVDPGKRGSYSAVKEMVSLISGMAFTLTMGYIIDYYEGLGSIQGGFLFVSVAGLISAICSFICLQNIAKDTQPRSESVSLKPAIKNTLGNKQFLPLIVLSVLVNIGTYMTSGFLGTYKIHELMMTVGTVQIIGIVGQFFHFIVSKPFGKFSDKHSFAKGIEVGYYIAAAAYFINAFTNPSRAWLIVVFTMFNSISSAGTGQNGINIIYNFVDKEYFSQAYAFKNTIGGIVGFGASLVGSKILGMVKANGNTFLGIPMYGQQLLSIISAIFLLSAALYTHFVIDRQKAMVQ